MANMILGMIIMGRRYTPTKYASVMMISLGIAVCTIMSGKDVKGSSSAAVREDNSTSLTPEQEASAAEEMAAAEFADLLWWIVGISMLTFALFLSARMGIYQEVIYAKYGKYPREALFYSVSNVALSHI